MSLVVSERGTVVPSSIQVDGTDSPGERREFVEIAEGWTFRPARYDGCWVPARFDYRIVLGEIIGQTSEVGTRLDLSNMTEAARMPVRKRSSN